MCGEDFDEFLAGVGAGADFAEGRELRPDAEFFFGFADGAGFVAFAGFEMAGGAGVPFGGLAVFPGGALLQEEFAFLIEDENVDGAVEEVFGVHFGAWACGDDFVLLVDDVELLAVVLRGMRGGGIEGAGKVDPLDDGQIFGAAGRWEILLFAPRPPDVGVGFEQRLQLFAALAETALHEVVEERGADRWEFACGAAC